jgi:glycosyltransferase involved in cell wall biosynthesis
LRILWVNWRDSRHPQGGGSERYVERMAEGLAARGHRVTVACSQYDHARGGDWVGGVKFRRRGNRLTVYLYALLTILRARADVVVDVQNGMPFFSRMVARCPVLVLVHHVHKEQWQILFGPLLGKVGWWIESVLAPRLYRRCQYVTVSQSTRQELAGLGVSPERIAVVANGLDPVPRTISRRSPQPRLVTVSRLVPHKQIEHAIETVARLRDKWPGLRLDVVGQGPWMQTLQAYAQRRGVADRVRLHGWVEEAEKHEILARSWVHLCPSAKEGWGIAILEAAAHGVPTVAYTAAGGVRESVVDGQTGLLAGGLDEFVSHVDMLLGRPDLRAAMEPECRSHAAALSWDSGLDEMEKLIRTVAGH